MNPISPRLNTIRLNTAHSLVTRRRQMKWVLYLQKKIPWRRQWQPTPVLLPGKSHGQRSLVGYSPWGRKESDTTERLYLLTYLHETQIWKSSRWIQRTSWPFGNHGVEACGSSGAEVAEPLALSTSVPTANSRDKGCQALQTFYEPTSVPCILKIKRSLLIQFLFCWEQPVYDFYCNQKFWPIQLYHQYKRDQQFFLPS